MSKAQYEEFTVMLGDSELLYFIDGGFYQSEGYYSRPHSHNFSELLCVVEGSVCVTIEDQEFCLGQGSFLAVPQKVEHAVVALQGASFAFLSFWDKSSELDQLCYIENFSSGEIFLRLLDYYYGDSPYRSELVRACLVEISARLFEAMESKNPVRKHFTELRNTRFYTLEYYMHSFYNKHPSLEALSRSLNLSLSQTDRTVRQLYGMTFREKIRELRIEEAKMFLLTTSLPISKISESLGYATVHNFYVAFKRATGQTPGKFRRGRQ